MAQVSRQIGWSNESNLLYQILKQLNKLTSVLFGLKEAATPKYKVYTALLTQSGDNNVIELNTGTLIIGATYKIVQDCATADFTNVGAPNNYASTSFVATGTTPNNWGDCGGDMLEYNTGAPVAIVLENTIGNIWFTYDNVGYYQMHSNNLFTNNKTWSKDVLTDYTTWGVRPYSDNTVEIFTIDNFFSFGNAIDNVLNNTPIEIRVYN